MHNHAAVFVYQISKAVFAHLRYLSNGADRVQGDNKRRNAHYFRAGANRRGNNVAELSAHGNCLRCAYSRIARHSRDIEIGGGAVCPICGNALGIQIDSGRKIILSRLVVKEALFLFLCQLRVNKLVLVGNFASECIIHLELVSHCLGNAINRNRNCLGKQAFNASIAHYAANRSKGERQWCGKRNNGKRYHCFQTDMLLIGIAFIEHGKHSYYTLDIGIFQKCNISAIPGG